MLKHLLRLLILIFIVKQYFQTGEIKILPIMKKNLCEFSGVQMDQTGKLWIVEMISQDFSTRQRGFVTLSITGEKLI